MQSFFSIKEIMDASATSAPTEPFCNDCGLFKTARSPKMPYTGEGRRKVLIVAEGPGEQEDRYNRQLVGQTGDWVSSKLKSFGYDLYKDFWLLNSVNCRSLNSDGSSRNPTPLEVNHCRPYVDSVIKQLKPKAIILFGAMACHSFFSPAFKNSAEISNWESLNIPSRKYNAWLLPLYHPQYAMRNLKDENLQAYYDLSIQKALSATENPFPQFDDYTQKVKLLYNIDGIISILENILIEQPEIFFFDYEANGLKPRRPGYKIVTQSFCTTPSIAYSFPYQYRNYFSSSDRIKIKSLWRRIMQHQKIKKVAHNFKFENSLTVNIFGTEIENKYWCTMDAAHIEDDRFKYTGLKSQTFIKFGVEPYNAHIEPYLESIDPKTGFNKVDEIDLEELLTYGAYDSLFGYRLLLEQKKTLDNYRPIGCGSLSDAREFFFEVSKCFMDLTERGMNVDVNYYLQEKKRLGNKIEELKKTIRDSKEAQLFRDQKVREVKIGKHLSDDDLRIILFEILKIPPHKLTSGGEKISVDADSLERVDLSFIKTVVDLKHTVKIDGNYINGFIRESENGVIHPTINLHIARSFRSSMSDPNLQNVPIREEEAKKSCRSGIFPDKDQQFIFADYKGIEVCVAAIYSGDKNLIKYITDPKSDMHKDKACELWILPSLQVSKDIRFYAKNKWVFAQFYGDWYGACAEQLWFFCLHLKTNEGITLEEHLIKIGMFSRNDHPSKQLAAFKNHCKTVEDRMWNEQFGDLKVWQIKTIEEYRKKGYVTLKHGFRRRGYQNKNQIGNTPIQGTAFHLLCKTITECNMIAEKEQWRTSLRLQIHDEMIGSLEPPEYKHVRETMNYVGTKKIREDYEWINVPLTLEFEVAPLNFPWYYKTEIDEKGICTKKDSPWFGENLIGTIK